MNKIRIAISMLFLSTGLFTMSVSTQAQISGITLQASGLTCSMCSNSINKALQTIDFVDKVEADIKSYTFQIHLKPSARVNFDIIRKKVEGAGFSVARLNATIQFNNFILKEGESVRIDDRAYLFVNTKQQLLNGPVEIRLLEKGFMSPKEYSRLHISPVEGIYHITL